MTKNDLRLQYKLYGILFFSDKNFACKFLMSSVNKRICLFSSFLVKVACWSDFILVTSSLSKKSCTFTSNLNLLTFGFHDAFLLRCRLEIPSTLLAWVHRPYCREFCNLLLMMHFLFFFKAFCSILFLPD